MYREQEFSFIYQDGVLKPEVRLNLPEGARGIARIREAEPTSNGSTHQAAVDALRRIGDSGAFNSGGCKLTRDEMHERG